MQIDPPEHPLVRRARKAVLMAELLTRSRCSRQPITGEAPIAVCLTSYAHRLERVHLAIESIARSEPRPQRFILWVAHEDRARAVTPALDRLVERGLEIRLTDDYGPHKKNYPYARDHAQDGLAMVTADDDILYPEGWLAGLAEAQRREPEVFLGYRAHELQIDRGAVAPYAAWPPAHAHTPGPRTFVTGGAGAVFPPAMMQAMAAAGEDFMRTCPRADDVWINVQALRSGVRTHLVPTSLSALGLPGVQQKGALHETNVHGGNDAQIAATYAQPDIHALQLDDPPIGDASDNSREDRGELEDS